MGWATTMLMILNNPQDPEHKNVLMHFAWVKKYEKLIKLIGELVAITEEIRHKIRMEGVTATTHAELEDRYLKLPMSWRASDFCGKVLDFFENVAAGFTPEDRLLGMSEIIESLFGKLKALMREDLKKGFTGSVLFAAACVGQVDDEIVKKSLEAVVSAGLGGPPLAGPLRPKPPGPLLLLL